MVLQLILVVVEILHKMETHFISILINFSTAAGIIDRPNPSYTLVSTVAYSNRNVHIIALCDFESEAAVSAF